MENMSRKMPASWRLWAVLLDVLVLVLFDLAHLARPIYVGPLLFAVTFLLAELIYRRTHPGSQG